MEVTFRDILPKAYSEHRGVFQFNIYILEDIEGIIEAAYELNVPVIIGCTTNVLNILGGRSIVGVYRSLADYCSTPIVLHLDHAHELKDIWKAISAGFTSVMIDGSNLSYEGDIELTQTVVEIAKAAGISVEGTIGSTSDIHKIASFTFATEIDVLELGAKTDLETLEKIKEATRIPLAIHNMGEISTSELKKLIPLGITKIDASEELPILTNQTFRELLQSNTNIIDVVSEGKRRLKEKVKELFITLAPP